MADYMTMFVLMPDGERLPIEVDPYGTVDGIYASTSRALGMEPTRQAFVLRYQGDELDRGEELSSLTFTHGSEVELVRCERTKGEALRLLKKMHAVKKKTVAVTHAHLCQHAESGAQSVDRARQHAEIFVLFLDAGAPASPKVMTCAAKRGNHLAIAELAVRGVKPKPDALLELSQCKRVMNGGSRVKCLQLLMEAGGRPVSAQVLLAFSNLPDAECCKYIVENRAGREAAASALLTAIHINSSSAAIRFLCTRDSAQEDKDEALRAACVLGTTSSRGVVEVLREAGAKATRVSINKTVTAGWKATNHSDDAKWPEELWGALIDDGAQLGTGSGDDSLTRAVQLLDLGLCRALVRRGHVAKDANEYLRLLANVDVDERYTEADEMWAERRRNKIRTLLVEETKGGREAAASALLTAIHINSSSAAIRFLCTRDSAQEDKDEALRAACVLGTTSSRGVVEVLREAGAKATRVSINKTVTAGWKATNHSDDDKWPEELWGALIDDGAQLGTGSDDSLTRAVQLLDLGLCRALVRRGHVAGGVDYLPLLANVAVARYYEYADVPLAERRRSQIRTLLVEQAGQVETPVEDVSPARVEAVAAPVQTPRVQAVKKDGCCVVC